MSKVGTGAVRPHSRRQGLRFAGRVAACAALALLMHLSAWQSLAGIRVSMAGALPDAPTIEVGLIGPSVAAVALPNRRAMVHTTAPARRTEAALQATIAPPVPARRVAGSARSAAPAAGSPAGAAREHVALKARAASPPASPAVAPAASPAVAPAAGAAAGNEAVSTDNPASAGAAPAPDQPHAPPEAPSTTAPATSAAAPAVAGVAPLASAAPAVQESAPASIDAPFRLAAQVVLPKSARLVYDSHGLVRIGGFSLAVTGRTTTQWHFEDGRYQSDLSIDVASFTQSSRGQFDPQVGLAPDRYTETRHRNKVLSADFDWARRKVTFADPAGEKSAEPGTQDFLSIQYQLSVLRQIYPERFVRGGMVPIMMAGTGDIKPWVFTVTGEDSVDSGMGRLPALRIVSNRTSETGDESLEVWLSERLGWFPARIRMVDKHRNMFDFVLDEATIN